MCLGRELVIFMFFVLVIEINYLLRLLSKTTHLLAPCMFRFLVGLLFQIMTAICNSRQFF